MTRNRYGQVVTFTDCSGYQTRYEYNRVGQITAIHQEEGLSQYFTYDSRGRLISRKDAQGRETRYEYNTAGDLTATVTRMAAAAKHSTTQQGTRSASPQAA
jgi:YD repeat-containing protein